MDNNKDGLSHRLKRNKAIKVLITFIKSAAVGMLFAVLCFAYDIYHDSEQDKQLQESIDKLIKIEQGLSTRYLGIFPNYIEDISLLFNDLNPSDTVIIFEDVLYYGIKSRPKEFYNLNIKLFNHVLQGGHITIAYYDYVLSDKTPDWVNIFHKMIIESRIDSKYQEILRKRRNEEIREIPRNMPDSKIRIQHRKIDSTLCEEYFSLTRTNNIEKFTNDINAYLKKDLVGIEMPLPTPKADNMVHQMCVEIDSVKQYCLGGKPVESICFSDYTQMYRQMSEIIVRYYKTIGIDLIPLNEYLTMSCWMVRKGDKKSVKTVLAFPSKYSTDEIGFYSQDEAFSKYIGTMLKGVRQNMQFEQAN